MNISLIRSIIIFQMLCIMILTMFVFYINGSMIDIAEFEESTNKTFKGINEVISNIIEFENSTNRSINSINETISSILDFDVAKNRSIKRINDRNSDNSCSPTNANACLEPNRVYPRGIGDMIESLGLKNPKVGDKFTSKGYIYKIDSVSETGYVTAIGVGRE